MKSRISLFNGGIARNLLRRFWPLWAAYLALLLLLLPAALPHDLRYTVAQLHPVLDRQVLESGRTMLSVSFFVGVAVAMAMFHYLYQSRACCMMNSLPLRRETMFFTAYLTGLLPLLLADLLAALVTALLYVPGGYLHLSALLTWLALTVLGNLACYNFAVFCATLTGSLIVLPVVYAVLNFTAAVAEAGVHELLEDLVYGLNSAPRGLLNWLSPPVEILSRVNVRQVTQLVNGELVPIPDAYALEGLWVLAVYAAVSLLFLLFGLWLYRRRHMETATDVVAVPVLKPVFKYCLSFGTAVVFAPVLFDLVLQYPVTGWARAAVLLLLLLVGAFLGYFAAEMLIRKTLRVFRGTWRGYLVTAAVLTVLLAAAETDVTGFERRVPDMSEVSAVSINGGITLTEPENIEAAMALHRHFIEDKKTLERLDGAYTVRITYMRHDGSLFNRQYSLPFEPDQAAELYQELNALGNLPEAVLGRIERQMTFPLRVGGKSARQTLTITGGVVSRLRAGDADGVAWDTVAELSAAQARELYEQGVLADAREGNIGRMYFFDQAAADELSDLVVTLYLSSEDSGPNGRIYTDRVKLSVEMDAAHTLRILLEQFGLEAVSQADAGLGEDSVNATGGYWW